MKKKKKNWGPKFGQKAPKTSPKVGFLPFSQVFCLLIFLESVYNDSLQQCPTYNGGKIHEKKNWGSKIVPKGPKSGQKLGFLPFFQVWLVFLEIAYNSLQQCITSSRGKTHEKNNWGPTLGLNRSKPDPNYFYCHFLKFPS